MASSTPSCVTYSGRIGTPPWSQRPPPLRKSASTTALGGGWRGARGGVTRSSSAGKAFAPRPRTTAAAKSQQKEAFVDMSMHVDVLKPCDTIYTLKRAHDELASCIASSGGDPRRMAINSETEHSKHFRDFTPEERASAVSLAPAVEERTRKVKEANREAYARRVQIQQQEALLWKQLRSDVAEQCKNSLQDGCGPSQPSRTLIRSASEPRCGNSNIFTDADAAGLLLRQAVTVTDLLKTPGQATATGTCPPTIAPQLKDMFHAYKKEANDSECRESGHRASVSINSTDEAVTSDGTFGLGPGLGVGGHAGCEFAAVHKKMDGARTPPSIVPQIKAMFAACKQTARDDTVAASEGGASTRSGSSSATSGSTSSNMSGSSEHKEGDASRAWRGGSSRSRRNQSAGATRTSAYHLSRLVNLASLEIGAATSKLGRSTQGGTSLSHRGAAGTQTKSPTTRPQTRGGSARRPESRNSRGGPHSAAYMAFPVSGVGGLAMRRLEATLKSTQVGVSAAQGQDEGWH